MVSALAAILAMVFLTRPNGCTRDVRRCFIGLRADMPCPDLVGPIFRVTAVGAVVWGLVTLLGIAPAAGSFCTADSCRCIMWSCAGCFSCMDLPDAGLEGEPVSRRPGRDAIDRCWSA
jgi:hypothetical protein